MKLLLNSALVLFATLLAAALVAFGEPGAAEVRVAQSAPDAATVVSLLALDAAE
jgi:hypothetical protein